MGTPHWRTAALLLLKEAYAAARAYRRSEWDFAVAIGHLRRAGLTDTLLRRLVVEQYVQHGLEITAQQARQRRFQPIKNLSFPPGTCFVLTRSGEQSLRNIRRDLPHGVPTPQPRWDREEHQLWLGPRLLKRFRRHARDLELILTTFEELDWPARIDDPLVPGGPRRNRKVRLHDAIKKLNRGLPLGPGSLRFHGDGTGQGVRWRVV